MPRPWTSAILAAVSLCIAAQCKAQATASAGPLQQVYEWQWRNQLQDVYFLQKQCPPNHQISIAPFSEPRLLEFATIALDGSLIEWLDHSAAVFQIAHDVLYRVEFDPMDEGGTVIAIDLRKGRQLWSSKLVALGSGPHSGYANRINFRIENDELLIYGIETAGRYVEAKDPATGKTKVNTQFRADFHSPRPTSRPARRQPRPEPVSLPPVPRLPWKWDEEIANRDIVAKAMRIQIDDRADGHLEIAALDLGAGKEIWRAWVHGMGRTSRQDPISDVCLRVEGSILVISGRDSRGRFVEEKNIETGVELVNTQYWNVSDK